MNPAHRITPFAPLTSRGPVARVARLALKELRETLRDRRTIITLVLMPLLVYPLLSVAFQKFLLSSISGTTEVSYRVAVESEEDVRLVGRAFRHGYELWKTRERRPQSATDEVPDQNEDDDNDHDDRLPYQFFVSDRLEQSVADHSVDVGVKLSRRDPFRIPELLEESFRCELLYNESSFRSREALAFVERILNSLNAESYRWQLRELGVTEGATAVRLRRAAVDVKGTGASPAYSLATLIPLILILMTITGAVYPAIDLTAGERERGTLEILIAAPVPRLQLLLAKYAAVVAVAMMTATVNLASMIVTVLSMGLGPLLFGDAGFSMTLVVQIFGLLVLFASFFSAVLLALTSFARSFKEAQAYLIPLMLVSIAPGMLSMLPGLSLHGPLAVTPLANIVLLARDLFEGQVSPGIVVVVVLSTALFALAAIGVAARIFGTDAILYGSHGTWSDLWHRPSQPATVPTLTSALLCLALLFPANFLLGNTLARIDWLPIDLRLAIMALITALLFGVLPLAAAAVNRLQLREGFRLLPASGLAFAAALALGLSLWAFAHEVVVLQGTIGLVSFSEEQIEAARRILAQMRSELSPVHVLLALAVVPAVCEEFFFRGYLLSALATRMSSRSAVLLSGLLFGLFHLLVTDRLAVERFLPSTLLGLVLGWVCVRTRSIVPGMLLHAAHNGLLMMISYYQPELAARGFGIEEQANLESSHLPASWLAGAGLVAAVGFGLMSLATRETAGTNSEETGAAGR